MTEKPLPSLPAFAERLRRASLKVRGIGYNHRTPEAAMLAKDEIANELDTLAAMLERGAN